MNEPRPRDILGREETIFSAAVQLGDAGKRAIYLDLACEGDPALRARIEGLLASDAGDNLFAQPLVRPVLPSGADASAPVKPVAGAADAQPRAEFIGAYKLREKIGEGGCGVVYVAEQEEPVRRKVALKVIKLGMDTRSVVARFEAERQALALMDHPNIAKVLEAGATETGRPYFVMELVRGLRITEYCDRNHLSTRERLDLFIQVCRAVQHAHQKGIIHRDLKPSNILVTVNDGVAVPKVIDFGIAKATEGRLTDKTVYTELHHFLGTPAYMSPEQAELTSVDIDTRSDIYSLGVLLYELLTGGTPFDQQELLKAGLDAMRQTIRTKEPPRPSTRLSTLGAADMAGIAQARRSEPPKLIHLLRGDLDWIVMKCLEKDRARRYETANGLARDLERHLDNEPVVARPPSTAYRLQKAVRRNKLAFAAAAGVAAALVVGIAASTWQAVVAARAKTKAVAAQKEAERAQEREKSTHLESEHQLYAAKMNLAQQAWEQDNIGRLRQLLDETQHSPDRGFEWYFWQSKTHLALQTLGGHLGSVWSVAFSPDGRRIVTGSADKTAKVWDSGSGKELVTLRGHSGGVRSAAFSPDGQRVVTGGDDQTAKVWEAATGTNLLTLRGHSNAVYSVAFSPDGQRIVTGSHDRTAKVWEAATGTNLLTLRGHSNAVYSVAFSPDGQRIVTGSHDRAAKVWEAASGNEMLTLAGHSMWVFSAAFSPDGRRIVTGSGDQTARVWDATNGAPALTLKGHSGYVYSAAFSPDGQRILTGGLDGTARVWDAANGAELFTLKGHSGGISSVAFSPNGQWMLTGSEDWTARIWDAASGLPADKMGGNRLTLRGHSGRILSVAFSPDGSRIVTGGDDMAKVWEAASGREVLPLAWHSNEIRSVAFSRDGQRVVTGSADETARVWDAASGKRLFTLNGHSNWIMSVACSPDGRRILTGSRDQTAKVWDAASGKQLLTLKGHSGIVFSVAFSWDGQRIVTGSGDGTAKVWQAANGNEIRTLQADSGGVTSVAFSPDSRRIVTAGSDPTAKVWEAATGRELLTLRGHRGEIDSAAFSPDGRRIVTASSDSTAKVWEAVGGLELLTLKGHSHYITSAAFSSDGQRIVTGSYDRTAKVWEAATAQQVEAWQDEEKAATQRLVVLRREGKREEVAALEHARALRAQDPGAIRERARRAQDPGAIKQWLVLAPIAFEGGEVVGSGGVALGQEQVSGEAHLRPRAGDRVRLGQHELVWSALQQEDYVINFNQVLGEITEWSAAYAVCYIHSETAQTGLRVKVGSDDQAKIYLNGKEIYRSDAPREYAPDQDLVTTGVELSAGLNVLVFKVINETLEWLGSVRFTDAAGQPVKGISVTVAPP